MQNYAQGLLLPKDANKIERHLLECDLCREAMEGLENFTGKGGFVTDVDLLKHRISQEKSNSKSFAISYRYVGIAASIIAILGVASIFMIWDKSSIQNENIAEVELDEEPTEKVNSNPNQIEVTPSIQSQIGISDSSAIESIESFKENAIKENRYEAEADFQEEIREEQQLEEVNVVEYKKELLEKDAAATMIVPGTVAPDTTTQLAKSEDSENFMEDSSADEIFVESGKADNKRTEIRGSRSASEARYIEAEPALPRVIPARPEGGQNKFDRYVRKNIRYPSEASENGVEGSVRVSFSVGADGKLSQFRIIDGIGFGCDEEAIRLIKEGPKWEPATEDGLEIDDKVELEIQFEK